MKIDSDQFIAICKTVYLALLCLGILLPVFCFSKKFGQLLGRLDAETQQQGEARVLRLISTSVQNGLSSVWICFLVVLGLGCAIGLGISVYGWYVKSPI